LLLENDNFPNSIPLNTLQAAGANKCSCNRAPYAHAPCIVFHLICFVQMTENIRFMTPVRVIWQYGPQKFSDVQHENWAYSTFDPQLLINFWDS